MTASRLSFLAFVIFLGLYSTWYLSGVKAVPFHPDESTYLFMSGEPEAMLHDPLALAWQQKPEDPLRQHYRLLNPPVIHTVLALGRYVAGQPALAVDWNWTQTWEQNVTAGALPTQELLHAGRMAAAGLFPLALLFLFLTARRLSGDFTAWLAALLLASNALVLLHTRRAMAEGPLLFSLLLSLWVFTAPSRRATTSGLAGATAGLAFCAKHSLVALAPIGLLAAVWGPGRLVSWNRVRGAFWFGVAFVAVYLLFNPVTWKNPLQTTLVIARERVRLATKQAQNDPANTIDAPAERIISAVAHIFIIPPRFAELANYQDATRASEQAYLSNPLHNLFRTIEAGAVMLTLSAFGFLIGLLRLVRARPQWPKPLAVLIAATIMQTTVLLATVPLSWQRYYLPVIPFVCLWTAYGLDALRRSIAKRT